MATVKTREHIKIISESGSVTATYDNEYYPIIFASRIDGRSPAALTIYPSDLNDAIDALTALRDELREQGKL